MPSTRSAMIRGENNSVSEEADRLEDRAVAHESDIGIDREPGAGQQAGGRIRHSRGRARRPSASLSQRSIPPQSRCRRRHGREGADAIRGAAPVSAAARQGRVLHRDLALVVVAVERPGLDLAAVELAVVQQLMKRVADCDSARRRWRAAPPRIARARAVESPRVPSSGAVPWARPEQYQSFAPTLNQKKQNRSDLAAGSGSDRSQARHSGAPRNLFHFGAGVGIDFHADGDFDDPRCGPLHGVLQIEQVLSNRIPNSRDTVCGL